MTSGAHRLYNCTTIIYTIYICSASQTDVIYLDFKKAFDSVAHNELLCKLWKFGITGDLWLWVRAYLSNRVQYVSICQSTSPTLPVSNVFASVCNPQFMISLAIHIL